MKRFALIMALLLLCGALAALAADQPTADQIAKRSLERDEGKDKVETLNMLIAARDGKTKERTFTLRKLTNPNGDMQLIRFVEPARYKNYGFLSLEHPGKDDDRWMFMANTKKTIRIETSNQNDSFMESDLSYYDMSEHSADDSVNELKGSAVVDGKDCWVLSSVPKDKDVEYSRIESYVWKEQYIALRVKMFDSKGQLFKELSVLKLEQVEGYWTVMQMKVSNLQAGSSTTLTVREIKHNLGLKPEEFTRQRLENP